MQLLCGRGLSWHNCRQLGGQKEAAANMCSVWPVPTRYYGVLTLYLVLPASSLAVSWLERRCKGRMIHC